MRIARGRVAVAAMAMFATLALEATAGAPSDLESVSSQVAAEERQISDLERRVNALLRPPVPTVPAGATPVASYLGGGGELPHLDEHKRLDVRHLMLVELERGGVTEVDYDDGTQTTLFAPPWQKAGFAIAPLEVLVAIRSAAMPALRGVELDLRVATATRGVHFVTLVHELDGPLRVTDIAAASLSAEPPQPALSEAELRKRFAIGSLDGGAGRWSADELQSLERALALLSESERMRIRGVELRRESRPRRPLPFKGACGITHVERIERWVEIYDCAFREDDIVFAGNPTAPERASVRLILHELGHVLAIAPVYDFNRDLQRLADDGKKTSEEVLEHRADASIEDQRAASDLAARLRKIAASMQAVAKRVGEAHSPGPAVSAFSRVPGAANGITSYGRESPAEAFAEAFSLFHTDPDALRRVSPTVLEFLQRGEHLLAPK